MPVADSRADELNARVFHGDFQPKIAHHRRHERILPQASFSFQIQRKHR